MASDDCVPPPATFTVDHEHRARLYLPDGRAVVRAAGFTTPMIRATQTTGTCPPLHDNTRRKPSKKGKR